MQRLHRWAYAGLGLCAALATLPYHAAESSGSGPEIARATLVKKGVDLDGRLSEPDWQASPALKIQQRPEGGLATERIPTVRLLADAAALYVGLEVPFEGTGPFLADSAQQAWHGQSVFSSDYATVVLDCGRYGQFEFLGFHLNPKGDLYFSTSCPLQHAGVMDDTQMFNHGVKASAVIEPLKHVWTAELKIPFADVLFNPKAGIPKYLALNVRSVQWGKDGPGLTVKRDWSGSIGDEPKFMQAVFSHTLSWRPLPSIRSFDAKHEFKWAQFIYPDETGIVEVAGATLENKLIHGQADDLLQLRWPSIWFRQTLNYAGLKTQWRLERREDTRPKTFSEAPLAIAQIQAPKSTGKLEFLRRPELKRNATGIEVSFQLSQPSNLVATIRNGQGKVLHVLFSGNMDAQAKRLTWDRKDGLGQVVSDTGLTVDVRAGIEVKVDLVRSIEAEVDGMQDFSELLDVDHLPNPVLKNLGSHNHGGGGANILLLDRARGELYLPKGRVHDASTGEFKRRFDVTYRGPLKSGVQQGEVAFAHDGTLYVSGFNELWHCNEKGLPIPFSTTSKPFVADLYRCHSNPHRGHDVGPNGDIYYAHHLSPHGNECTQVSEVAPDGTIKQFSLILMDEMTCAGVKVDSKGHIYVGTTIRPAERILPPDLNGLSESIQKVYNLFYGSIVKFSPKGGRLSWDEAGTPALIGARSNFGYKLQSCSLKGAEIVFPDYAPMVARGRGDSAVKCPCRSPRFELDEWDRLFVPDAFQGRINIYGPDGSKMAELGTRGTDISKLQFRWPIMVAAQADQLFVLDFLHKKVAQVKMSYELTAALGF